MSHLITDYTKKELRIELLECRLLLKEIRESWQAVQLLVLQIYQVPVRQDLGKVQKHRQPLLCLRAFQN